MVGANSVQAGHLHAGAIHMTRRLLVLMLFGGMLAAGFVVVANARADVGGSVPAPGTCDYPAIGSSGLDGPGVFHYVCDYPTEINGSHHHCQWGGAATLLTVGASMLIFNSALSTQTGIVEGVCWWACPDLSVSPPPNPVAAWQNSTALKPATCKTVAPNPLAPPPDGDGHG
jgi:hypothetical protein